MVNIYQYQQSNHPNSTNMKIFFTMTYKLEFTLYYINTCTVQPNTFKNNEVSWTFLQIFFQLFLIWVSLIIYQNYWLFLYTFMCNFRVTTIWHPTPLYILFIEFGQGIWAKQIISLSYQWKFGLRTQLYTCNGTSCLLE